MSMTRTREQPMVPRAEFSSYYGRPVVKRPPWKARDIAGYFFLGGLAGASSLLAAGGHGRAGTRTKVVATAAIAAMKATSTIPIIFAIGGAPVRLGLVSSLSRPGGNITGATIGGFILALAEELGAGYVSSGYRDAMGFLIIIVVLLIKPTGLFARAERVG